MNFLDKIPTLALAMIIDALMIIPYVDFVITIPLTHVLWERIGNNSMKYVNMGYDLLADFAIPVVGDLFPLNTTMVIALMIMGKKV